MMRSVDYLCKNDAYKVMNFFITFFVAASLMMAPFVSSAQFELTPASSTGLSETALLLESIQRVIAQLSGFLSVPTADAACSSVNFQASTDFSSIQGSCGWSYHYGNTPMSWVPNNPDGGGENTWKGNEQYLLLFSDEGHPGQNADAIRRWTSPSSGTATISGTVSDTDTGGGDGVIVSLKKGGVVLWGPVHINGAAGSGLPGNVSYNISTSVSAGTAIDFVINKGPVNNWWDRTLFNPRITLATNQPTPVAYLNSSGTVSATLVQGQSFTLGVNNLYPGHEVYYDQLSGPNGAVNGLGPIGTALSNGSFTRSFSTAPWPIGTYTLVVYTKSGTVRTSNNSNSIYITVTAPSTNYPPTLGNVSPANGSSNAESEVRFTTTYSDQNGWQNLSVVRFLVNSVIRAPNAFYASYNQQLNRLYLINDAGNAWLGGCIPGSGAVIENSYAKLACSGSSAAGSGNNLTVTFAVTFKSAFAGTKNVYMYAWDDAGLGSTWIKKGTWSITSVPSGNSSPVGYLDGASCSIISGWTCDADNYDQPIGVHLYADGPAGTGAFIGSTIANVYRGDLISANVCGGKPYHGFSFATPALVKNGRPHSIYAYGLNIGGSSANTQLTWSGQKSVSCSYAAPSSSLKYFGFAGVGGDATSVAQTMPFSNAPHMGVDAGEDYTSAIRNVNQNGGRPIVGVHNILFATTVREPVPPSGNADWSLHPNYIARWNAFRTTHASVLTPTNILAFYMADEPVWNGISASDLKIATDLVAASYPSIPRIVVEAWPVVSRLVVPASMSWIAFDKYGVRDPATDPTYKSIYNTLKSRRSSPSQKMFIIGDAWFGAEHTANDISIHGTAGIALNYYNFAKNDPDVVALIGFLWPSFPGAVGARDLPASARSTYKLIGQSITGK